MAGDEKLDPDEKNEQDLPIDESTDLAQTRGDEVDLGDEDEVNLESAEGRESEKGAVLILGQGDPTMCEANRGADDPGDNTLSEPQYVCKYGEMLFVSDRGNHRVLVWDQIPQENGEPAGVVLGQEDFADCLENRGMTTTLDEMTSGVGDEDLDGFTVTKSGEDSLSQPAGVAVIDGKLYVVDSGNHRVVRWETLPSEDGEAPGLVLGQDNLEDGECNRRGNVGSGSLFFPMGICSGDDQHVFVVDKDNHRVLFWKKIPFSNGWNADIALGQASMDEREPNRGDFDNTRADTLSFPTGVCYDAENDRLFVVDQGNNRVLIWNKLPNSVGQPADVVIGQKDFHGRTPNAGQGTANVSAEGLYFPTDVTYGRKGLFVSDTSNNRVLVWKEVPTENGRPADLVIGQKTFTDNKVNRGGEASACTLNDPCGLFLDEDPEDEEDIGRLYIADRGNSRVVVWEELPEPPQEEKPDDEEDDQVVYEQEELMGDDDEFLEDYGDEYEDDNGGDPSKKFPVT
ncbi:MAG: NHL repeat-containing protein [Nitrospinales bacterium]